ncbi:hypothetical protein KFE25_011900 [Diacronema lutheri]|uniref:Uncharacterized protein n=1 Tax=Diacronema lutheri TaxID=2081491 RepID=A0A8J5XAC9_DIALT|nr:hypothetical protein KFE25_011900 [Diacronema lutheri]
MTEDGEAAKAVRALRKKLRHIDELTARNARGEALDAQQQATVARAGAIAAELAALEAGGCAGGEARARASPDAAGGAARADAAPSKRECDTPRKDERAKRVRTERQSSPAAPATRPAPTPAESCGFCRAPGHRASRCTFGRLPSERVMLCPSTSPAAPCAPRLFVLPMRRCAWDFDPAQPRAGRVDVGLRCASAALFRSQGLRRNTQVALCFEGEPAADALAAAAAAGLPTGARTITLSGGLARDLRPDELSLGQRVRAALDDKANGHGAACALDDTGYSASPLRGLECTVGGALETLVAALRAHSPDAPAKRRAPPAVLVLDGAGEPVEAVCARLAGERGDPPAGGVVVIVGDDRGLTADEERAVAEAAAAVRAPVLRVSLGREVLFASHCVVLLHHYLDKLWHGCAHPPGRQYSTSTRTTGARPIRRARDA